MPLNPNCPECAAFLKKYPYGIPHALLAAKCESCGAETKYWNDPRYKHPA